MAKGLWRCGLSLGSWEIILDDQVALNVITWVLVRGRQRENRWQRRKKEAREARAEKMMWSEVHELMDEASLQKQQRARKRIFLWSLWKDHGLAVTDFDLGQMKPFSGPQSCKRIDACSFHTAGFGIACYSYLTVTGDSTGDWPNKWLHSAQPTCPSVKWEGSGPSLAVGKTRTLVCSASSRVITGANAQ